MLKGNRLCMALVLTGAMFLLASCGSELDPPADYILNGDMVESLNTALGEENSGKMTEMQTPETKTGSASSAASVGGDETCLYAYEKLETGGESVRQYVEKLTAEEDGFRIVDENGAETDPPDYTAEEGSVALAKAASEDGKILRMDISWTATDCRITLTRPEGTVSGTAADAEPMTYVDAVDFIKSLSPAMLGLKADSMADYSVYPMDGAAMVDGILCLKLQVYPPHEKDQANAIAGTYLLSGDKEHLYLLKDDKVRELPL